jgi:ABC-type phosphate transport system auxiliary subunit
MSKSTQALLDSVLALPGDEREALIGKLLEFDDDQLEEDGAEFEQELARRIEEVESGKVKPLRWTSAEALILEEDDHV